jgi:hypothetical protein
VCEVGKLNILFDDIDVQIVRIKPSLLSFFLPAIFAFTLFDSDTQISADAVLAMQIYADKLA